MPGAEFPVTFVICRPMPLVCLELPMAVVLHVNPTAGGARLRPHGPCQMLNWPTGSIWRSSGVWHVYQPGDLRVASVAPLVRSRCRPALVLGQRAVSHTLYRSERQ
jgi:hypothetical protein